MHALEMQSCTQLVGAAFLAVPLRLWHHGSMCFMAAMLHHCAASDGCWFAVTPG